MLKLKSIEFEGIGRFEEKQSLDTLSLHQMNEFDGKNLDTGGSSGAGKTSVFDAITYNLGLNDKPATVLQCYTSKTPLWTKGLYDWNGVEVIIERGIKSKLSIQIGEEVVSGNAAAAEEKIDLIIGVPRKMFQKMIYKKQKEGGFFLNLTPKSSYEFLIGAVGLELYIKKAEVIDQDIKAKVKIKESIQSDCEAGDSSVKEYEEMLSSLREPTKGFSEDKILETQENIKKNELLKAECLSKKEEELATIPLPEEVSSDDSSLKVELLKITTARDDIRARADEEKEKIKSQSNDLRKHIEKLKSNRNDMDKTLHSMKVSDGNNNQKIESEVTLFKSDMGQKDHLEKNNCPTCLQKWQNSGLQEKINQIEESLKERKTLLLKLKGDKESYSKQITALEKSLEDLDTNIREKNSELSALPESSDVLDALNTVLESSSQAIGEINSKIANIKDNAKVMSESNIAHYKSKRVDVISKYDSQVVELFTKDTSLKCILAAEMSSKNTYIEALGKYKEDIDKFSASLEVKKQRLEGTYAKKASIEKDITISQEALRLVKNYCISVFQETLDQIGIAATEIISKIPNMHNASIYFEGCKETNSGKIKDEVTPILSREGYNDIDIRTLSGGERTSIDLIIDWVVLDMLENKVNIGADFFMLDEPFTGLEDVNIEECLEVLKSMNSNKKIMIIDHNPIAKEHIANKITIIKENGVSRLEN